MDDDNMANKHEDPEPKIWILVIQTSMRMIFINDQKERNRASKLSAKAETKLRYVHSIILVLGYYFTS